MKSSKQKGLRSRTWLEFFEPPAVPGFGAAGDSLCLLDQTNTGDYQQLGQGP
ncbi:MAG: hypothetical protein U0892_21090 [Pirellulales bacterium]